MRSKRLVRKLRKSSPNLSSIAPSGAVPRLPRAERLASARLALSGAEAWLLPATPAATRRARQVGLFLAREEFGLRFSEAGGIGGVDRTTARYACRQVAARASSPRIRRALVHLAGALRAFEAAFREGGADAGPR